METGNKIEAYFDRLWPICRSITGNGLRESLNIISELIPLKITEVPSGTQVFDWEVPDEWNIEDAYIVTPTGEKIADFKENNLHVLNYSHAIDKFISWEELKPHLFTLPEMPDAIPYVTSYYKRNWGFCLSYNAYKNLQKEGMYRVVINSTLKPGSLTYGDLILKGETDREILFSTYLCHPSMANNELSGPLCLAFLYQQISKMPKRKYTYRFIFAPETIGVIAYLAKNGMYMKEKTEAGFVLTCCGDNGDFVYKMSKQEESLADRVAKHVLKHQSVPYKVISFAVGGSDERQYCSPGFKLPVGSLTRSMYQQYKEYHTSLDNKNFISFTAMQRTIETYFQLVKAIELNDKYVNTIPYCEPQLGKRNLYPSAVKADDSREKVHNMMHLLSYSDGEHDLLDIAESRNVFIFDLEEHVDALRKAGLLIK